MAPPDHQDFGIETAIAGSGKILDSLRLPGEVRMNENAMGHVSPRFSGMVKKIYKRLGDSVKSGEPLAEMESNDTLRPFELNATLNGTITEFHITPGESFEAGARMYTISDTSTVWVDLSVYQRDLPKIHPGLTVTLDFGHDYPPLTAKLDYLGPIINENTRTGLVRAIVPNPDGLLRPGLFVIGEVQLDQKEFPVVIPRTALLEMDGHTIVFIETADGFEAQEVEIGAGDHQSVAILHGLPVGQKFVSKGGFFLKADAQKENFGDGHAH
jgi:cobalt-zinc-cadmium efflux system membrane fusion protein